MEQLWWLHLKMVEEFLRISKGSLTWNDFYDSIYCETVKSWQLYYFVIFKRSKEFRFVRKNFETE